MPAFLIWVRSTRSTADKSLKQPCLDLCCPISRDLLLWKDKALLLSCGLKSSSPVTNELTLISSIVSLTAAYLPWEALALRADTRSCCGHSSKDTEGYLGLRMNWSRCDHTQCFGLQSLQERLWIFDETSKVLNSQPFGQSSLELSSLFCSPADLQGLHLWQNLMCNYVVYVYKVPQSSFYFFNQIFNVRINEKCCLLAYGLILLLWGVTSSAVLTEMQPFLLGALYSIIFTWHSAILGRPLEAALG